MSLLGIDLTDEPSREEVCEADRSESHLRVQQPRLVGQLLRFYLTLLLLHMVDRCLCPSLHIALQIRMRIIRGGNVTLLTPIHEPSPLIISSCL